VCTFDQPTTRWHDQIVKYIQDKRIYAFHSKYCYGKRALVEAQFSRIKRCIDARQLTDKSNETSRVRVGISVWRTKQRV
jgi:hypothetical protein